MSKRNDDFKTCISGVKLQGVLDVKTSSFGPSCDVMATTEEGYNVLKCLLKFPSIEWTRSERTRRKSGWQPYTSPGPPHLYGNVHANKCYARKKKNPIWNRRNLLSANAATSCELLVISSSPHREESGPTSTSPVTFYYGAPRLGASGLLGIVRNKPSLASSDQVNRDQRHRIELSHNKKWLFPRSLS